MADLSSHPDFDLDVALSADLDGELDAYADELGVPPAELRAALADPSATTRRAELAGVRASLAPGSDPADDLDEVSRRRLLAGAGVETGTARARPTRDRSWIVRAGAAAAVTLVVLGAIYALTRNTGQSAERSGGSSAGGGATAVTGDLGDIGAIDAAGIGRLLRGDAPAKAAPSDSREFATQDGAAAGTAAAPAPGAVDACASQYSTAGTVRFRASGAYQGTPAVVLGIDTDRRTIVFVVAADNCARVLYSLSR